MEIAGISNSHYESVATSIDTTENDSTSFHPSETEGMPLGSGFIIFLSRPFGTYLTSPNSLPYQLQSGCGGDF